MIGYGAGAVADRLGPDHQAIADLPAEIGFAFFTLCRFVRAQKFFCIMGSPKRYGLPVKFNRLGLPIANDPAFFDMDDCVHRPDP